MSEQSDFTNQPTSVNKNSTIKKTFNWKLMAVIVFIAIVIIGGFGYWIIVQDPFDGVVVTEESKNTKQKKPTPTVKKQERFVFYKNESGIYSVKTDGTSEIKLSGQCCDLRVSRDNSLVAFINNHNLWVVGVDGKGLKQLTTSGRDYTNEFITVDVSIIDWSPDNTKILYYLKPVPNQLGGSYPNTPDGAIENPSIKYGIYLFDLAKGKEIFVIKDLGKDRWQYVGWPKNTEKALFNIGNLISEEFSEHIYSLNLTDSSFTKFSSQKYPKFWTTIQTSISDNGKLFTWHCAEADSSYVGEAVCVSNIDGTEKRVVATGKWGDFQNPRFLPGSKYISFQKSLSTYWEVSKDYELYLFDIDTGKTEKKTVAERSIFLDQDTIVTTQNNDIYKIEISTGNETLLAKEASFFLRFYH